MLADKLNLVKKNIEEACDTAGRSPQEVTLIAVSKTKPVEMLKEAYDAGARVFGENNVQDIVDKYDQMPSDVQWHMIGHLQRNKVKYIIDKVTLIHAVDRYSLLKEIEKQAAKRDLEMPVLIQVNIAKEESKHGFEVEEIDEVFNSLKDYPHVKVRGLMMMAPHIESSETERYFKMTQELLQRLQKDYQKSLNHVSTMIRIGSALFKYI